ncbi:step II splicing factor, putative [Plasmodium vinckei vinckei]|uniref:Pre-mRNA-splicing factor SLU7 n=1 Tax=Plasmodium vinckei vinckei TaxID=54757 RepID=A0A449BYY4_PLAVN|nr:step II splicing factor, putative [Plasmodium vinckei vinckei]VEV58700.1 step II splicing factor, putative [Plasmodium vinckei vinckei]
MWINKIGNKSASFINHKHFHPGNIKNLEKVWLAEEKERLRKEEEEKYLKKREEQYKLYALKKQLRQNELNNKDTEHDILYDINKENKKKEVNYNNKKKNEENVINPTINKLVIKSKYNEDIFVKNHKSIYGSYYDRKENKWGYMCCKQTDKNIFCPNNPFDNRNTNSDAVPIKKDIEKVNIDKKKKKKKKKKGTFDNSITAILNKL